MFNVSDVFLGNFNPIRDIPSGSLYSQIVNLQVLTLSAIKWCIEKRLTLVDISENVHRINGLKKKRIGTWEMNSLLILQLLGFRHDRVKELLCDILCGIAVKKLRLSLRLTGFCTKRRPFTRVFGNRGRV
jgi:hypothetical protein